MRKTKPIAGFEFVQVPLEFYGATEEDVFARKNNKTLRETIATQRYRTLARHPQLSSLSNDELNTPLGDFLMRQKAEDNRLYKLFLNDYGDLKYTSFAITDKNFHILRGIYAYCVDDKLKYIGRCTDNMRTRVNNGYGRIAPKNCYKDGQSTNCRINNLVQQAKGKVTLWLHQMDEREAICERENFLISELSPPWNIQK